MAVTTTSGQSGFYGDLIIGDPPATGGASTHQMVQAMAALSSTAAAITASAPLNASQAASQLAVVH